MTPAQIGPNTPFAITEEQATSLVLSLPRHARMATMHRLALDDVLAVGHFVAARGKLLEPAPIHHALVQLREDFDRFQQNEDNSAMSRILADNWEARLMIDAGDALKAGGGNVDSWSLLRVLDANDRLEDLFQSHVTVLRLVEMLDEQPREEPRRPYSVFGDVESQNVKAERVTPEEVVRLVDRDVRPVGTQTPAAAFGVTEEERIERMAAAFRRNLPRAGLPVDAISDEAARSAAAEMLKTFSTEELDVIPRVERDGVERAHRG